MRFSSYSLWPLLAYIIVQTSFATSILTPNKEHTVEDTISSSDKTISGNISPGDAWVGDHADRPSAETKMESMRPPKLHLGRDKWLYQRLHSETEAHRIESLRASLDSPGKFTYPTSKQPTMESTIQVFEKAKTDPSPGNVAGLRKAVKEAFGTVENSLNPYNKENEQAVENYMRLFGVIALEKSQTTGQALVPYDEVAEEFKKLRSCMNEQKLESMSNRMSIDRLEKLWKGAFSAGEISENLF